MATSPGRPAVELQVVSRVGRDAAQVWARVTTPQGIADELWPWLRMTTPPGLRGRTVTDVPVGVPVGRAWLLLGGVLPVEYDDLCLVEVGERHFAESSATLLLRVWEHHRRVEADGEEAAVVTDTLRAVPRALPGLVPGLPGLVRRVLGALFTHRHGRLARWAEQP